MLYYYHFINDANGVESLAWSNKYVLFRKPEMALQTGSDAMLIRPWAREINKQVGI